MELMKALPPGRHPTGTAWQRCVHESASSCSFGADCLRLSAIRTPEDSLLTQPGLEHGFFAGRGKFADMSFHTSFYTPTPR
jgi:hypothetical protein